MADCESQCKKISSSLVKRNFIDLLVGRTLEEKLDNFCHITCIKSQNAKNYKRNGRWGFSYLLGFTEFFSSFFALISFFANIYYFNKHDINFVS